VTVAKTKPKPNFKAKTATEWLAYIEALHPKAIAMGLERVKSVADKLELTPKFLIITVAGTNGKGSVCAILSQIYVESGYRVGCYTSPHLNRYNERVCVNLQAITDDDLCAAFEAVEAARSQAGSGGVQLTYFEMGTLAAMWHFCRQNLDVCILEVGLGGRLDAVNIFESTCAIVTAIDLDHMEYLGDTREKIGFEKAGVFRANRLAICGDDNPPQSLLDFANQVGANLQLINRDFSVKKTEQGWNYLSNTQVSLPNLGLTGEFQLNNAACAMCAVQHLDVILPVLQANIHAALRAVKLSGRFQQIHAKPDIWVDVAHNPQAAKSLARNLQTTICEGKTLAVFGMLADKDVEGVISAMANEIDAWYLADIHSSRGAKAQSLHMVLQKNLPNHDKNSPVQLFQTVVTAIESACKNAAKNDRIIVFGSFYTVADAIASKFNSLSG
jgi:dihydrofolate synthase / folylpolyglutamate synthase